MRRLLAALFALGFVAVAAPALAETTLEKISGTGVLTVGTRRGSPPFGFVNKTNEWVGFSIDLVEQAIKPAIEKKLGKAIRVELKESTPATRIPLLTSNQVDLIAETMTDTRPRRESVDFYSYEPFGMAMRKNESDFRAVVNNGLIDAIESGQYFELYEKWFGPKGE